MTSATGAKTQVKPRLPQLEPGRRRRLARDPATEARVRLDGQPGGLEVGELGRDAAQVGDVAALLVDADHRRKSRPSSCGSLRQGGRRREHLVACRARSPVTETPARCRSRTMRAGSSGSVPWKRPTMTWPASCSGVHVATSAWASSISPTVGPQEDGVSGSSGVSVALGSEVSDDLAAAYFVQFRVTAPSRRPRTACGRSRTRCRRPRTPCGRTRMPWRRPRAPWCPTSAP